METLLGDFLSTVIYRSKIFLRRILRLPLYQALIFPVHAEKEWTSQEQR